MIKIQRFTFLILLITFVSAPALLQGKAARAEISVTESCDSPFSAPQDSGSPNQPIEEDLGDDDDQDKKLEHESDFYVDSNLSALSRFHLLFREQHHEVVTPPPQS